MATKKTTLAKALTSLTNAELWDLARKYSPTFASHTAQATKDLFTEKGFASVTAEGLQTINEWFQISLRVYLNIVNISHARDLLSDKGFGEVYDQPYGAITQRMAVESIKPISPAYKNLKNGDSIDQQIVRKPVVHERFYDMNFDYQSFITMQDYNLKQIFISERGMSEVMAGIMTGLENGWTIQRYENKLEVINAGINADNLNDTQVIMLDSFGAEPTDDDLQAFILAVKQLLTRMSLNAQTGAFNVNQFRSVQDKGRLKMLVRAGVLNMIDVRTLVGAYNPEYLNLNIDIIEVEHFGGLQPFVDIDGEATALYPVYSEIGEQIGWATTEGANIAEYEDTDIYYVDPNADVIAVIADKGWLFETLQNEYRVIPAPYNARGLYQNMWASAPNNGIHYDNNYNFVVIRRPQTTS